MIEMIAIVVLIFVSIALAVGIASVLIDHLLDFFIFIEEKREKWKWKHYIRRIK